MTAAPPGPAPTAPGALGQPPAAADVLDYLAAMNAWTTRLRQALDDVDARARLGGPDQVLTADVTLAYALGQSIENRLAELTAAWDSGRVGPRELDRIGQLLWSRLDGGTGGLAVTLTEACVLAEALLSRLAQRLENDPARSSAAHRATDVRAALDRCRRHADALGDDLAAQRVARLAGDLDRAVATPGADAARAAVTAVDAAVNALERDLIVAGATRARRAAERESLGTRLRAATARAAEVRAAAARCAAAVARPPLLAVPDPERLGPVPADDAAVAAFAARLDRVEAALREAGERYAAALAEPGELRGLLDAYRAKAAAVGRTAPDVAAAYDAARAVLDERPCDLDRARDRVGAYRRTVDPGDDARTTREGGRR
ncbi:MAG TPA: hypothetical protein VFQ85_09480 [Mycobacteriales bacterium]|jgi:hypothetical protein|nr:hypothetical protein [Mycobacteriales bacterium]